MSSIYLTGDVVETADLLGLNPQPDWRTLALSKLQRCGMRVVNPILGAWANDDGLERRVRRALDLIDQADAMLANLNAPGHGTPMEMFYAHRRGKMVAVVGQPPFSPWVLSHSMARFEDVNQALDFIIEEYPRPDLSNWCLQFEGQLSEHYEQFPPSGELDYQFIGGDLPVLTLAPHATAYFKESEFQEPDMFTGCMAAAIHRLTHCHALLSYYCLAADPVWHTGTPMMRALGDIVKSGAVGAMLVIVGSPWHESPGLIVESAGPNHEELASRLRLKLASIEPVGTAYNDLHMKPLVEFVSQALNIPILVLRTHRRYRMPRLQTEPFEQVISLLAEFVAECGLELQRDRS